MFAKATLILTLIVSLLLATQVQPMTLPVEMKQGGGCAAMQCAAGCCSNVVCCKVTEQQKAPPTPAPASHSESVQLAAIDLREIIIFFTPPVPRRPFVILDEASTAHTLSPLAVSCIRLI